MGTGNNTDGMMGRRRLLISNKITGNPHPVYVITGISTLENYNI